MCYNIYISTDCQENLSEFNSDLCTFDKVDESDGDPCTSLLDFPYLWYVGSRSGCSCGFRHLVSTELGFSDPVDWYHEDPEDIAATGRLHAVLDGILSAGHHVDLLDLWEGATPRDVEVLEVSFDDVAATEFRLFENHRFILKKHRR